MAGIIALTIVLSLLVGAALGIGLFFWWLLNWPVGPRF